MVSEPVCGKEGIWWGRAGGKISYSVNQRIGLGYNKQKSISFSKNDCNLGGTDSGAI